MWRHTMAEKPPDIANHLTDTLYIPKNKRACLASGNSVNLWREAMFQGTRQQAHSLQSSYTRWIMLFHFKHGEGCLLMTRAIQGA